MKLPLILASRSPRRKELLEQLRLPFRVMPPEIDERVEEAMAPEDRVSLLAGRKAESVARIHPDHLVIGADTMVVLGGKPLGKPGSEEEAVEILRTLSGKVHRVMTGLSLVHEAGGLHLADRAVTWVRFIPLRTDQIEAYVATGEPMDKAGAYAIQGMGAALVERIDGCYSNVVGLPLNLLARMLREAGVNVWEPKPSKRE
jgi:septum formation protein